MFQQKTEMLSFHLEHFNFLRIYLKGENLCFCRLSAKESDPLEILDPQIENTQIATFVEGSLFEVRGFAICGIYLQASHFCCTQFFTAYGNFLRHMTVIYLYYHAVCFLQLPNTFQDTYKYDIMKFKFF
jgi:hypothetical protein